MTPHLTEKQGFTNHLAREKSPYLLQHQHNPVNWYAWGDEAFEKARQEKKPIFLSIGYSTCHWCHVMERESFEDEQVAEFLNQHFVSIKVDREERPDVDKIYMTFVQAMTGQGGWPLNVFITPELKPFYGGTYWPPEDKFGRPGFLSVLRQVQTVWKDRPAEILASAKEMHQRLDQVLTQAGSKSAAPGQQTIQESVTQLKQGYDPVNGGWGGSPKFPTPSHPAFLLQAGTELKDKEAVEMVLRTCERMYRGGIYDQIGGGFHRYSVDEKWLVPHFEKMLYDNAQLLGLYLDCFLQSGQDLYAEAARGIIRYVLRDMTHPEGGFYSAEDADSEGKEGKFYCWTQAELSKLLTVEEFNVAKRYFGITQRGNFVDHSDPNPLPDQNVLSVADNSAPPDDQHLLRSGRDKMFNARSKRVRPHLDDKILASWNGLMLGAMSRAYAVLREKEYLEAAQKNLAFLKAKLWEPATQTLHHRWRDGERDAVQLLDAYAYLLYGALELYQVTLQKAHLKFAVDLADSMIRQFGDEERGGFWQSGTDAKNLILRVKEDYDGAEPSGNSVAILALIKLSAITGRKDLREAAEKALRLFAERLKKTPQAVPYMLMGLAFSLEEPRRVVIAGEVETDQGQDLLFAAQSVYQPRKIVMSTTGPVEEFAKTLTSEKNQPTAYLCTGASCQPPTHDSAKVIEFLKK